MGLFSALKLALLGLLVMLVLSPAAGASFFKKALLGLAGLILLVAAYFEER